MEGNAILGGGFGGLSLALAFDKNDIQYRLFEQKESFTESNHALIVWPSSVKILLDYGLGDMFFNCATKLNNYTIKNTDDSIIQNFDLANYKYGVYSISKSDYNNILLFGINKNNLKTNSPYYSYKAEWGKAVKVDFHQGVEKDFDYVFGADGPMSPMRLKLYKDGKPEYAGYTIWRGVSDYSPSFLKEGEVVDFIHSNRRFIAHQLQGKTAWWAVSFESNKFLHQAGNRKKKMYNYFKDWNTEIMELILGTEEEEIIKTGAFLRNPAMDSKPERVLLFGDANMMFSPLFGKGAGIALEEAFYFAKLIKESGLNSSNIKHFNAWRIQRNIEIADYANKYANAAKFGTLVGMLFGKNIIINKVRTALTQSALSE